MNKSSNQTNDTMPIVTHNQVTGLQPSGRTYTTYIRRGTIEPTPHSGARPDNTIRIDPSSAFRRLAGIGALNYDSDHANRRA